MGYQLRVFDCSDFVGREGLKELFGVCIDRRTKEWVLSNFVVSIMFYWTIFALTTELTFEV